MLSVFKKSVPVVRAVVRAQPAVVLSVRVSFVLFFFDNGNCQFMCIWICLTMGRVIGIFNFKRGPGA